MLSIRLKELRDSKGWSRKFLSDKLGISVSLLTKWESENPEVNRDPSTTQLTALADAFEVTTDYLLGRSDIPLSSSETNIYNDIENNLKEIVETYGIPIGDKLYSIEELEAIVKMINRLKHMI